MHFVLSSSFVAYFSFVNCPVLVLPRCEQSAVWVTCACMVDNFHVVSISALLWNADLQHRHRMMKFFLNCRSGYFLCEVDRRVVMSSFCAGGRGFVKPKKLGNFIQNVVWERIGNTKGDCLYLGLLGFPVTHCFKFVYMYYFCRLLDYHLYGLVFPTSVVDCKKIVGVLYKWRVKALYCRWGRRLHSAGAFLHGAEWSMFCGSAAYILW